MEELYGEGIANHIGSESCAGGGNVMGEALTGVHAGWVLSRERFNGSGRRRCWQGRKTISATSLRRDVSRAPRGRRPHARMEALRTRTGRSHEPTFQDGDKVRAVNPKGNTTAMYEEDFKGFSYGFRPGRGAHNALDALSVGIERRKVNWILDADIRGFFDAIDHEWLIKFVEHRIADRRVIRHIKKWLKAGVLENGLRRQTEVGLPQGGSVSPLLANIYLHYAFDLWAEQWRKRNARGEVIIVRYADDIVVGFEHRAEAERFQKAMKERFLRFNLELHAEKTRLIEFGRYAAPDRFGRGDGKPETFDFLGFTHICGKSRRGDFALHRRPMKKRVRAKLRDI